MKSSAAVWVGWLLIVGGAVGLGIVFPQLPEEVPFFYSMPWGEKVLVNKWMLCISLGVLGLIFLLDMVLAKLLSKKDEVLGKVVLWFGVGVVVMHVGGMVRILMLML